MSETDRAADSDGAGKLAREPLYFYARPLSIRLQWPELALPGDQTLRAHRVGRRETPPVATRSVTFRGVPTSLIILREAAVRARTAR